MLPLLLAFLQIIHLILGSAATSPQPNPTISFTDRRDIASSHIPLILPDKTSQNISSLNIYDRYPIPGTQIGLTVISDPMVQRALRPSDITYALIITMVTISQIPSGSQLQPTVIRRGNFEVRVLPTPAREPRPLRCEVAFKAMKGLADWMGNHDIWRELDASVDLNGPVVGTIKIKSLLN